MISQRPGENVGPQIATHHVAAGAAFDTVIAGPTTQRVGIRSAEQVVIARAAVEQVSTAAAGEQCVVARTAVGEVAIALVSCIGSREQAAHVSHAGIRRGHEG